MSGAGEQGRRAWSFLVAGEARQFQGNTGYDDVLEESYSYDSTVGNHKQVAAGDLVVVRDGRAALGVGHLERVDVLGLGEKARRRCRNPDCRDTGFKERKTKPVSERYLCSRCGWVFEDPCIELLEVTNFRAHYGATWQALEGGLGKDELEPLYLHRSKQQSIREMDRHATLAKLAAYGIRLPSPSEAADRRRHPGRLPGGHRRAEAAVRRGQDAFRQALIREYGMICAVTGPAPAEALQAAHLRPFAAHGVHRVEEGLMLRADIHSLLDNELLAIGPDLKVHVAPNLLGYDAYRSLHGTQVDIPENAPLDMEIVRQAYEKATATW
ncbi:HNH endonuclease [Streptomyces fragilis]|uniref:HNH endonuclease signature motif containing protein n=1 Tax=Streptomyces fragilis TaxID=67301 RepID=A0ABV2YEI1_9ACTN|nr:HNH endonuclease signature motif containing protein [Streptomyces fragilis]